MNDEQTNGRMPLGRLILVPALITLGVTFLRLTGELMRWSPAFFSREAGGAGALVGIVWLVPVFGIYFALKLTHLGQGPKGVATVLGHAFLALLLLPAAAIASRMFGIELGTPGGIAIFAVASLLAAVVAGRGWPALGRTLFAYGLAARVPVALLMLVAILGEWGTHYEKGAPGFPTMGAFARWFWIGLVPQLTFWVGFTIVVGAIFGGLAVARPQRAATA